MTRVGMPEGRRQGGGEPSAGSHPRAERERHASGAPPGLGALGDRVAGEDWPRIERDLDDAGFATIERILTVPECRALADLYAREELFRSRVVMARHGFGRGEYQYFRYPLPALVAALREAFYVRLAPIANRWSEALGAGLRFPETLAELLARCRAAGQAQPTPLLLKYGAGDYNRLHRDLYGEQVFPLQVVVLLSEPGRDFEGGELVLTEQRPRMQSRAAVVPLRQGDAAVFAVHDRPVQGARRATRVGMRHGVSTVRSGTRFTAGIIFHDAK